MKMVCLVSPGEHVFTLRKYNEDTFFLQLIRLIFFIKKHLKYSQYKLYEVKTIEKPTRKEINKIT